MIYWLPKAQQDAVLKDPETYILTNLNGSLDADTHFYLGVAHDLLKNKPQALVSFKKALQKNLAHSGSLLGMSLIYFEQGKEKEARRLFLRTLRVDHQAAASAVEFQRLLRQRLGLIEANQQSLWCLEQLHKHHQSTYESQFELAKILFESSEFQRSASIFQSLLQVNAYNNEASQYLSYIFEKLYRGNELIEKTLNLAFWMQNRSDTFFNLAMVCQNDQAQEDLSLHFFYLASRADEHDPGLRFSLEQACLDRIGQIGQPRTADQYCHLMMAHLYHGSVAVAERYAKVLRERFSWKHPETFEAMQPKPLWQDWLLKDEGILGDALRAWFGEEPVENWKFLKKSRIAQ